MRPPQDERLHAREGALRNPPNFNALLGALPPTLSIESARGDKRLFTVASGVDVSRLRNRTGLLGRPGVDVKCERGQVVAPPSVHATGVLYSWRSQVPITELPTAWVEAISAPVYVPPPSPPAGCDDSHPVKRADGYTRHMSAHEPAVSGQRGHDITMKVAAMLAGFVQIGLGEDAGWSFLCQYNEACTPPWSERELRHKWRDGTKSPHVPAERPLEKGDRSPAPPAASPPRPLSPRLGTILRPTLERVCRRHAGQEKPVPLRWPILEPHFAGGFWPGLHIINAGTGCGKTQLALQSALYAAARDVPALYIGLELSPFDIGVRLLGGAAHVPWSHLWTGRAGEASVEKAHEVAHDLNDLTFHFEVSPPHGMAVAELREVVETFRANYPEADGPGSRPLLLVVDFLQIIGDEPNVAPSELRVRIGRASYAMRDFASRLNIAVLAISSIARERYQLNDNIRATAKLQFQEDKDGCPVDRWILAPDAIVGAGKESGDIEYSADSVTVLTRVPETYRETGVDVVVATAKGRATGANWSPMRFTGFRYEECSDRGGRIVEAWKEADARKKKKGPEDLEREEEREAAEKAARVEKDAETIRGYLKSHDVRPSDVTDTRRDCVQNSHTRWKAAMEFLGPEVIQTRAGRCVYLTLSPLSEAAR